MGLTACRILVFSLFTFLPFARLSGSEENLEDLGFKRIFDGKTLNGWQAVPEDCASDWSVEDGFIRGRGSKDRLCYLLWKEKDLRDFELRLKYRLPSKGNTGIEIRCQPDPSQKRPFIGYHADLGHVGIGPQILGAWDFHFANREEYPCPRGTRLLIHEDGRWEATQIPNAVTLNDIRRGDWNAVRVVVMGDDFEFYINGKLASAFTDNSEEGNIPQGGIALQIHDKDMEVQFKDIYLKKIEPPPLHIGLRKQLLVDDYVIEVKKNVTFELGKVRKYGVVLEPTLPTDFIPPPGKRSLPEYERKLGTGKKPNGDPVALDFGFFTTVLWNDKEKKFQMWYMAWRLAGMGYAESKDGIHWTKPLVGEKAKTNIVHRSQGFSCFIDPNLPWGHPEKYKAAFDSNLDRVCQTCLGYSPNGIRWFDYNGGKPVTGRAADFFNQILWDPLIGRYRLICRTDLGSSGGAHEYRAVRIMVHNRGNNLKRYPCAWDTVVDRLTVDDIKDEKNVWGNPRLQLNWLTLWIYEGVYFALMCVYTMDRSDFFEGFDYLTRHKEDVVDFYIGTSRDGINFDRSWIYKRKSFIPRGPPGSFDKDGVFPPSHIVTYKGEHWIFYGGASERHYSIGRDMKIGLAKLPLDRFIGLKAGSRVGTVITKSFVFAGKGFEFNVEAPEGWIKMELLDKNANPIPEYSGVNSSFHERIDEIKLRPNWKGLSRLKGKTIRIRFSMRNAKLYSFKVE